MSTRQSYITLWCQHCGREVDNVDPIAKEVTCWRCVYNRCLALWNPLVTMKKKSSGKPPGWHWRKVFVAKDGTVYHKGKEQKKLKGTLKPTKFESLKKREKKPSKDARWEADTKKLAKQHNEKKKLQREFQKQKNFLDHKIDKG